MASLRLDNFRSPAALARFILTTLAGLGLDLWTKAYAFSTLGGPVVLGEDGRYHSRVYPFIPGWLEFTIITNKGAVFGIGQGRRWLFIGISAAAIAFLTYLFSASGRQRFYQFILGLLLAGVLGNMYDRVTLGYVRDMIFALPRWPKFFPYIFNVADVLLCCGVGLMILHSLVRPRFSQQEVPGFSV